ncbi:MAG TPA: hypothetical protein VH417_07195 [Vicinamibacterales bacterium]|jgi:hypothetical protein
MERLSDEELIARYRLAPAAEDPVSASRSSSADRAATLTAVRLSQLSSASPASPDL